MSARLTPLEEPILGNVSHDDGETFAVLHRSRLLALAKVLSTSAAVLLCIEWQSALQERMTLGPLAGQRVSRISARSLAQITGKAMRTVRWALAELKRKKLIETVAAEPGKVAVYRVTAVVSED